MNDWMYKRTQILAKSLIYQDVEPLGYSKEEEITYVEATHKPSNLRLVMKYHDNGALHIVAIE